MKKKDKSKNSMVDGLGDSEKLGGPKPVQQLMCCKASHLLNEEVIIPDLSTNKFPIIKHDETEEIKT